jgi:branched-chain amino acid transport system ATP-binding protein
MEALIVEGLSKDFGGVHAVSNISFRVGVGERLVIIGPNGAGKTTLFNLINGQLSPTAGRIYFYGQDITDIPTHRRAHLGQARSFQVISLLLNLTVIDNTLLSLHGTRPSRFEMLRSMGSFVNMFTEAQAVLEAAALWEKRDEAVKNLSYGEQRRLEIALSLASKPKLLLLDEPSSGLTRDESFEIIQLIKNLGEKITVLIVDHDMNLIFGVAGRIMVLHYGQVIADGTPEVIRIDQKVREIYMGMEECIDHVGVG